MKTFQQKREEVLARYDAAVVELRDILADPEWVNDLYPGYREARIKIDQAVKDCFALNVAENL